MIYLLIEFLDELIYGVSEAAWPFIRADLHLNYVQIGLALSLPGLLANFVEPFLAILGDVWKRRTIILVGGVFFALSLFFTSISYSFIFLLFSFILFNPASGAFVSLSQASLMDSDHARREQNMARWTFAGSLGVVIGPLLLGSAAYIGFGWRGVFASLSALAAIVLLIAVHRLPASDRDQPPLPRWSDFKTGLRNTYYAIRKKPVLRYLILLEFSDLMLDVLYSFLALYFVDVGGLTPAQAVLAVTVWAVVGLLGDFLLIPLLEKVRGLNYLRVSVILELILFPAFLLVSNIFLKLILLALLGFFNSGWYAILQAKLYESMPEGLSSTAIAVGNVTGFFGKLLPFGLGLAAQTFGLGTAMWFLLAGPLALFIGLPRNGSPLLPGEGQGVKFT
jgi:FSR family fosmidomycin resistance protein-like MFS transporter